MTLKEWKRPLEGGKEDRQKNGRRKGGEKEYRVVRKWGQKEKKKDRMGSVVLLAAIGECKRQNVWRRKRYSESTKALIV